MSITFFLRGRDYFVYDSSSVLQEKETGKSEAQAFA